MLVKKSGKFKYYSLLLIIISSFLLFGFFALAQEAPAPAASTDTSAQDAAVADLNKQIDEQRAKIDALAGQITGYQNSIKKTQSEAASLQNQISIINNQIAKTNLDLQAKAEEAKITELEIQKTELEIANNQKLIEDDKTKLAAFLRLIDRYDEKSYLSVLLGNNSFSEFFDQIKYSQDISDNLQKTLNRVEELVAKLNKEKSDLDAKNDQLAQQLAKLDQSKATLGSQKDTKQYLVTETKQSEAKFKNLVNNLKQEQVAANAQVAALEKQLRAKLVSGGADEKFNSLGEAALTWPVSAPITCYFHDPDYPFKKVVGEHSGVDLGVRQGTAVRAAEAGYVAKVAFNTKWYGTYIMIIHNNNLATLYGHLSAISVSADQYVSKNQVIGLSGNTGFSSGPHLHFEVRFNGIPVNPLTYLP